MLEIKGLSAGYGSRSVLQDVSVGFERGALTCVIGVNGCGKSTLLKTAVRILSPMSGEITVDGKHAKKMSRREYAQRVSYLSQGREVPSMTVEQLVLHGRFPHLGFLGRYTKEDRSVAREAMERMGLMSFAQASLSELSGGMRQTAYLAMALAGNADYILLDEPTTYLDVAHQLSLMRTLGELAKEGKGIVAVARTLQEEQVLVPMAYWQSKGLPRGGKKTQADPYKWCKTTIAKMLAQQEYCGDIINFKSTSKSFRNKTRVENPKENWAIFKDVHEPIIDRDTWEQVQKLVEKTKRRPPKDKNQKKSIFTSFLYCGDCGHKLWFNFNQKNPSIRFFSCSNYKGMRGACENTHYIREDALEQIVLMELRMLAEFLESAEDDFAELLEQKTNKDMIREKTTAEGALATAKARSKKLIGLFQKLYEDNVEGKVTDEWFMQLSNKYEAEQEELKRQMFELQEKLDKIDQMRTAKDDFLRAIRKFMEMQTLTPILLRELIEKIEVFPVEGKGKDRTQRVIIHYRFVGRLDIPGIIQRPHFILDSRQGVAIEYLPNVI